MPVCHSFINFIKGWTKCQVSTSILISLCVVFKVALPKSRSRIEAKSRKAQARPHPLTASDVEFNEIRVCSCCFLSFANLMTSSGLDSHRG